jgi:hypothetical protein
MVLIAMAFVSILGTILLLSAYTGFQIKAAEAKGERAFYSAEAALDEIRAGIQGIASDCIERAYTEMLRNYSHDMDNLEEVFGENFVKHFKATPLITQVGDDFRYNGALLWNDVDGGMVSGAGITAAFGIVPEGEIERVPVVDVSEEDRLVLMGVEVGYRSADGFVSTISCDIVVVVPDFSYVRAAYTLSGIPDFALIAANELYVTALPSIRIDGNAYAGSVNSTGGFTVDGTLISEGNINIRAGDVSDFTLNGALWANRISVATENKVELNGDMFIADDLVLNAQGSDVTLEGRYYGFGDGDVEPGESVAAHSSAIIVNGRESALDISGLSTLFLAGHSFIDAGHDFIMGQSISVKSDQLAYLIPENRVISHSMNPIIILPDDVITGLPDEPGVVNPTIFINGVEVVVEGMDFLHALSLPVASGHQTLYLFREFADRDAVNTFFEEYFTDHKEEIRGYINQYLTLTGNLSAQTSGHYYINPGEIELGGGGVLDDGNLTNVSKQLKRMFSYITRSLSTSVPTTAANPFDYIVSTDENGFVMNKHTNVALPSGITPFSVEDGEDDNVLSVIINCNGSSDYSISVIRNMYGSNVNLIISTGSIDVNQPFPGLIISNRDIQLQSDVTAVLDALIPSMRAEYDGEKFSDFLKLSVSDDDFTGESGDSAWYMNALVYHENWHKREYRSEL